MFDIYICEERMVGLIRFGSDLTEADFTELDRLASESHRDGHAFDCIFDMTQVTRFDLSSEFAALRGEIPQAYPGRERIYVVGQGDLRLLVRFFAGYQAGREQREPLIVETLDDAMRRLGVSRSDFRPLPLDDRRGATSAQPVTPRRPRAKPARERRPRAAD